MSRRRRKPSPRVYISSPYSGGNKDENVQRAEEAWHTLLANGYNPFCPHLTHFLYELKPLAYKHWLKYNLSWLDQCEALLRLPGKSKGADDEVAYAQLQGIKIFFGIEELDAHYKPKGVVLGFEQ
jgi:hypothetical protein